MSNQIEVLRPRGRLDSTTGPAFEDEVNRALETGSGSIVFDMANVQYISSAGLRIVLHAAKQAKAKGGRIGLCSLNAQIHEIFEISGFTGILDIFDSQEQALEKLNTA